MARLLAILALVLLPACTRSTPQPEPVVLVEVAPLVSLIQPLVGPDYQVRPIVPAGASPHGYQLTPGDARALASAALVITVGPPLDPGITRAVQRQTPEDRRISIASLLGIQYDDTDHHHHDHEHGEHCVHTVDPHIWLDPELMHRMIALLPEQLAARGIAADTAESAAATLLTDIAAIRADYADRLAPFHGRAIITHHNAFQRIADRYHITVAQVIRPVSTVEPTPGDLTRVLDAARQHQVGAIFIEPQYPDALPRRIADRLGLRVLTLNPEGSTDWSAMMRDNLEALVEGLSAPAPASDPANNPPG